MKEAHLRATALLAAVFVAAAAAITGPITPARAGDEIVVYAAASLKNALDDISADWSKETGNTARISLAGSSKLAKQIQQGAPADLFISANVQWMDVLQNEKLIDVATRRDILRTRIVLIAHGKEATPFQIDKSMDLNGLLKGGKLAMSMVDSVPAGIYGKAALTSLGMWETVSPNVAQTDNVRAALALVARGEAPYGIVYATDAAASDNVTVVATFPAETHPPIIFPAAVLAESGNKAPAGSFLDFLTSQKAKAVFERHGFTALEPVTVN